MAMSKERMGEIALLYLKKKLRREGLNLKPNMQRESANEAKALGISPEEASEFLEILATELFAEAFPKKS